MSGSSSEDGRWQPFKQLQLKIFKHHKVKVGNHFYKGKWNWYTATILGDCYQFIAERDGWKPFRQVKVVIIDDSSILDLLERTTLEGKVCGSNLYHKIKLAMARQEVHLVPKEKTAQHKIAFCLVELFRGTALVALLCLIEVFRGTRSFALLDRSVLRLSCSSQMSAAVQLSLNRTHSTLCLSPLHSPDRI